MKTNLKTRLLALLLCLTMLFLASCGSDNTTGQNNQGSSDTELPSETVTTPPNGDAKIVAKTSKVYINAETFEEIELAHYEDYPEIPLIVASDAFELMLMDMTQGRAVYELEETETTITVKRENGTYCLIDFVADTVYFDNMDKFFLPSYALNSSDRIAGEYVDEDGNKIYFSREESMELSGRPMLIDLANRDIPLDIYEQDKYIPFQTFSDLFLSPFGFNFAYNTKDLFLVSNGSIDPSLNDEYYSIEAGMRSEALADYTFNELCLMLDLQYGLQNEHGVTIGFENYIILAGLYDDMLDPDPAKFAEALASLTLGYFADSHSAFQKASPYMGGANISILNVKVDQSIIHSAQKRDEYVSARNEAMPDGVPGYQEIGNTAYVTFDEFTIDVETRFAAYPEDATDADDTLSLIIYAHSMINRENSPIENVVLDLSCNGGGAIDSAIYVVAWMIGYCDVHIVNPITEAQASTTYKVDVNLDNEFDDRDSIADKNLYCIISSASFSCGNLVPALLKESGNVTLIGDTSGGGACLVNSACTADGNTLVFSSPHRLSTIYNGSYYNIDQGVDPDVYLTKIESFYNREVLTEYINNLL